MTVNLAKVELMLDRPDVKTALTVDEHDVQSELFHSLQRTYQLLQTKTIKNSLNFIRDNELIAEYGIFGGLRNTARHPACGVTYKKGDVLSINFGTLNIGSELSFSHMGVVMADLDDYVVVVPVTTNRGQNYSVEVKKLVMHVNGFFRKNSTLLVHQIRAVHKNRINSDLQFSLKGNPAWEELQRRIAAKFSTEVVENYKLVIAREKRKNKRLQKEIAAMTGSHQEVASSSDEES